MRGKVALVTGAGMGMGRATAELFARSGASVLVVDWDPPAGRAVSEALNDAGHDTIFCAADVSRSADAERMVRTAVDAWGRLDCAVNNAGVSLDPQPIENFEEAEFDRIISVNLKGVLLCLKFEIQQMLRQGTPASIVNIGSVRSVRAQWGGAVYTAAKHGVVGLTKTAALENARRGIRVNGVLPGGIETPMVQQGRRQRGESVEDMADRISAVGRLGAPDEVAQASLWLCSDAASYVTGQQIAVDGGYLVR
ncbi:glucose dehydrogenase [Micromonospora globispora]|uniref:SDR family NAD(P)-dependent oxidoreductase n=1 Tax=Micromonospora globispora TaxID=1450148 RepID=UPI000D6F6C98|nr:glucose 1-dehydrogenase [Micromonospora globispora]PWU62265.1 glucose dehydrogenase [Micromonospora globispora]RQW98952.1 glucose dehydrogenase [Micromonospora globispora]